MLTALAPISCLRTQDRGPVSSNGNSTRSGHYACLIMRPPPQKRQFCSQSERRGSRGKNSLCTAHLHWCVEEKWTNANRRAMHHDMRGRSIRFFLTCLTNARTEKKSLNVSELRYRIPSTLCLSEYTSHLTD